MSGEGRGTKKRIFFFTAFLACTVGMILALNGGMQAKTDDEELPAATQPAEELSAVNTPQTAASDGSGNGTASNDAALPEPAQDEALPVVESSGDVVGLKIAPAGTGVPFGEADLEWVRQKSPGMQTVSADGNQEKDIMDSVDPKIRKVIEDTEEMVEELDEKTLQVTAGILEAVPFLNLEPEKAGIRPGSGGVQLSIELSPEALGIGEKQDGKPAKVASPDETGAKQPEKPDSMDEAAEGTS